jgi:hypothetical protein
MLTVPDPTLAYEPLAPGLAARELPLTVAVGPVTLDGVPLGPERLDQATLLTCRRSTPAAEVEQWDGANGAWVADSSDPSGGDRLMFLPGLPQPWQALLVAGGQPRFEAATSGYPEYSFRVRFATTREVAVAESPPVAFGSVLDRNLMVLGPGEGEQPDTATEARLQLKDPAFSIVGGLVVRREGASALVTLSNATGAAVVLMPDGGLELRPAPGRGVVVAGDLETERLVYRPGGGGPKKTAV